MLFNHSSKFSPFVRTLRARLLGKVVLKELGGSWHQGR